MTNMLLKKTGVFVLIVNLLFAGFPPISLAGLVGTGSAIAMQESQARSVKIDAFLARDEVQAQLVSLGVDPADARARVSMLTEDELRHLEQQIDNLPAGGSVLALIGAVFLVLLILELVGAINIFSKI